MVMPYAHQELKGDRDVSYRHVSVEFWNSDLCFQRFVDSNFGIFFPKIQKIGHNWCKLW